VNGTKADHITKYGEIAADVDGKAGLSLLDAKVIKQYVMGKIKQIPLDS
jgi:hypothetical protein